MSSVLSTDLDEKENKSLSYAFRIVDLHDLTDVNYRQKLLPILDYFIRSQAALHHAEYLGNVTSLEDNIQRRGNTFRGIVIYSKEQLPVAYAVYYPMVNGLGERGNYIEDAYVAESFRGHKVMESVYHELAKRCVDEGAQFLQWSTDRRNAPFHGFSKKMGAYQAGISTLVADELLDENYTPPIDLKAAWEQTQFVSVPVVGNHVNKMKALGVTPDIIRKTGDIDFKGFITFRANDMTTPIAVTPGWPHMSTFKQKHGLYLEQTKFPAPDLLNDDEKHAIILSAAKAARDYAAQNDFSYFKWHVMDNQDTQMDLLRDQMGFSVDTMVDTKESEMVVYTLTNGKLMALAAEEDRTTLLLPVNGHIGARPPAARLG